MSESVYTTQTPPSSSNSPAGNHNFGMDFQASVAGSISACRFFFATNAIVGGTAVLPSTWQAGLWLTSGPTLIGSSSTVAPTAGGGWQTLSLTTPVSISASTTYTVSNYLVQGALAMDYVFGSNLGSNIVNGHLTGLSGTGRFLNSATGLNFPTGTGSTDFFVDVLFDLAASGAPPQWLRLRVNPGPALLTAVR